MDLMENHDYSYKSFTPLTDQDLDHINHVDHIDPTSVGMTWFAGSVQYRSTVRGNMY